MLTNLEHCLLSQALCNTLETDLKVLQRETGIEIKRLQENIPCINKRIKAFNKYETCKTRKRSPYLLKTI